MTRRWPNVKRHPSVSKLWIRRHTNENAKLAWRTRQSRRPLLTTWSRKIFPLSVAATTKIWLWPRVSALLGWPIGFCGLWCGLFSGLSKLNITSGSRTYRIPSPTRALKARGSPFQPSLSPPVVDPLPHAQVSSLDGDPGAEKGQFF